jgi:excinuclease ABC subunit C
MREVAARRYTRVLNENLERPGLVMVDGGKGQVNAVREILDSLSLNDIPVVGLAKDVEEIVFDDDRPPLLLDPSDEGLRILIAIRDECHRFATSANQAMVPRTRRSKYSSPSMAWARNGPSGCWNTMAVWKR